MTLDKEEKKTLSKYRLEKAERLLEDARLLFKESRWESAVNRSYYAALSAAKCLDFDREDKGSHQFCFKTTSAVYS
jgi:uncharacterized protein (UPF0332 family)